MEEGRAKGDIPFGACHKVLCLYIALHKPRACAVQCCGSHRLTELPGKGASRQDVRIRGGRGSWKSGHSNVDRVNFTV